MWADHITVESISDRRIPGGQRPSATVARIGGIVAHDSLRDAVAPFLDDAVERTRTVYAEWIATGRGSLATGKRGSSAMEVDKAQDSENHGTMEFLTYHSSDHFTKLIICSESGTWREYPWTVFRYCISGIG